MWTEAMVYTPDRSSWVEGETCQCGGRGGHSKLQHTRLEPGSLPEACAATPQPTSTHAREMAPGLLGVDALFFIPDPTPTHRGSWPSETDSVWALQEVSVGKLLVLPAAQLGHLLPPPDHQDAHQPRGHGTGPYQGPPIFQLCKQCLGCSSPQP